MDIGIKVWSFIILVILVLTLVSSLDQQTYVSCGGDEQLTIECIGDGQNTFNGIDSTSPTITVHYPTTADVNALPLNINISINEPGNCNYSMDGGVNQTLTTTNLQNFVGSHSALTNEYHDLTIHCWDMVGNYVSDSVRFYFYPSVSGAGGGAGGGGTSYYYVSTLNLTNMVLLTSDFWYYDYDNRMIIRVYDTTKNLTDIDIINITLTNLQNYNTTNTRRSIGEYSSEVLIPSKDQNKSTVKIEVYALKNNQTITESIEIPLEMPELKNIWQRKLNYYMDKLEHYVISNSHLVIIYSILFLMFLFFWYLYKREKDKR